MARKKKTDNTSAPLFDTKRTTAPCIPALREKVERWRTDDYPGVTDTTRRLLNHRFLTDGWDVQSVTVIVGLRPYTAKAAILPEQTVGRGLRLMFRDDRNNYQERIDVIGNRKFIEFVEQLEREEDLQLDEFEIGKDKVCIVTIEPMPDKMD